MKSRRHGMPSTAVFVNTLPLVAIIPGSCHVACSLGWETAAAKGCGDKNAAISRQPNCSVALNNALAAWSCRLRRSLVILGICLLKRLSSQIRLRIKDVRRQAVGENATQENAGIAQGVVVSDAPGDTPLSLKIWRAWQGAYRGVRRGRGP